MDEKELDDILEEIRNHGKKYGENDDAPDNNFSLDDFKIKTKDTDSNTNNIFDFNNISDNKPQDDKNEMFNLLKKSQPPRQEESKAVAKPKDKNKKSNKQSNKKLIIIIVAIILIIAIGVGVYFGFFHHKKETPKTVSAVTTTQPVKKDTTTNPLTGEIGFNKDAVGKRPVAVVCENEYSTEAVKPQWGIDSADIVLEGETEFSTRLLLFWADYTTLPDQVGPIRSARPPFIHFSQLFDSVFIHAGLSKSRDNYVGADTVFEDENVDHINGLNDTMDGTYFGRDYTRTSVVEHTGFLNGKNVPQLLEKHDFDMKLDENKFSQLSFNSKATKLSNDNCDKCYFKWSGNCPKKAEFTYDTTNNKYTTTDFDSSYGNSNVAFENLIFLFDETEYVVKENYKGTGKGETYCNYDLSGGNGKVLSQGTVVDITWGVENGKIWLKTADGKELKLNPGKIYIGYGSSNHGGEFTTQEDETTTSNNY